MEIRDAVEADLPAIVAIYNATIPLQTVTADWQPVSAASRMEWFRAHTPDRRPLWVAASDAEILGWLGVQSFYGRPAYQATVELSLYVSLNYRRQGIGRSLLQHAIARSPTLNIKTLLGFIFADNYPSLSLFEQFGFQRWGYLPQVAEFGAVERDLVILGLRVERNPDN